jgi:hypothetical protein
MSERESDANRYLVIVRAGDESLHPEWLKPTSQRTWDLLVSYFGNNPSAFKDDDHYRHYSLGPKMQALHSLCCEHRDLVRSYDYVWLPDDDLATTGDQITLLFDTCRRFNIALGQPSLTDDSFVAHPVTINNPNYYLRFTNYVELMAPCFNRQALELCLPTFCENLSGWGQDNLWAHILILHSLKLAVVDAVQVRHTRQVGGPNYAALREKGISAEHEYQELLRRHRLRRVFIRSTGAVGKDGRLISDSQFARESPLWITPPS